MLFDQALRVHDEYLAFVASHEKTRSEVPGSSGVQLSCTRKGNHLDLKWTGVKWYGPKGKRVSKWIVIAKNKEKNSYSIEKIRPFAQEWEVDKILETEEKLTRIRRKAAHLVKGITAVRNAIRVAAADGEAAVDYEGSGEDSDD